LVSIAALRAADYADADVIGFVTEHSGAIEPVAVDLTGDQSTEALVKSHPADDRARPGEPAVALGYPPLARLHATFLTLLPQIGRYVYRTDLMRLRTESLTPQYGY
jgi:hypothetical protein